MRDSLRFGNFRVWVSDVTPVGPCATRAWLATGIGVARLVAKASLQNVIEGTMEGHQGTPGQSQTGSGAPGRNRLRSPTQRNNTQFSAQETKMKWAKSEEFSERYS